MRLGYWHTEQKNLSQAAAFSPAETLLSGKHSEIACFCWLLIVRNSLKILSCFLPILGSLAKALCWKSSDLLHRSASKRANAFWLRLQHHNRTSSSGQNFFIEDALKRFKHKLSLPKILSGKALLDCLVGVFCLKSKTFFRQNRKIVLKLRLNRVGAIWPPDRGDSKNAFFEAHAQRWDSRNSAL